MSRYVKPWRWVMTPFKIREYTLAKYFNRKPMDVLIDLRNIGIAKRSVYTCLNEEECMSLAIHYDELEHTDEYIDKFQKLFAEKTGQSLDLEKYIADIDSSDITIENSQDNSNPLENEDNEDAIDDNDQDAEDDSIDNSNISYQHVDTCIEFNRQANPYESRRYRLDVDVKNLKRKFPALRKWDDSQVPDVLLNGVITEGLETDLYARNLSMDDYGESGILAIRPQRYENDFLSDLLPDDKSLMFRGHMKRNVFVVDSLYDVANEPILSFEVECSATRWPESKIRYNFLNRLSERANSLAEHTKNKLDEWESFLHWNKALLETQVLGCRYVDFKFDAKTERLAFTLVTEDKSSFDRIKRKLGHDMEVFGLQYSRDKWRFILNDFDKIRFHSQELGKYCGVKSAGYEDSWEDYDKKYDIVDGFNYPYFAVVEYELPDDEKEDFVSIDLQKKSADENLQDFSQHIEHKYGHNGFIAESVVGTIVLNQRFSRAIENLKKDIDCYSPNLALWLFDITQARVPDKVIEEVPDWLNPNIAQNTEQKEAVFKMLSAPDVCLVQGPPGTGKTTVIAEAIYQFAKQGNRILVASQSNDAVDNALERLNSTPIIRAIRLGRSKKGRNENNENISKFEEKTALKFYYNSLAQNINQKWLDLWDNGEKRIEDCANDIEYCQSYLLECKQIQVQIDKVKAETTLFQNTAENLQQEIDNAKKHNDTYTKKENQLNEFASIGDGDFQHKLDLPEDFLHIIIEAVNPVMDEGWKEGIHFLAVPKINTKLFTNVVVLNHLILNLLASTKALKQLLKQLQNFSKGEVSPEDALYLGQLKEQNMLLMDQLITASPDKMLSIQKEIQNIRSKIRSLENKQNQIELTTSVRLCLTNDWLDKITSGANDELAKVLDRLLTKMFKAFQNAWRLMVENFSQDELIDIEKLVQKQMLFEEQVHDNQAKTETLEASLQQKKNDFFAMRQKYGLIESNSIEGTIVKIRVKQQEISDKLKQTQSIRNDWEDIIVGFKERLQNKRLFSVDQEFYQATYVNACNVVGISCTANQKNLSDKNYDDFDVVIIDEVSKATPPELLMPLMKAHKAILVGDHRQLPPMFKEHESSYRELLEEQEEHPETANDMLTIENYRQYQRMVTASLFKEYFEQADNSIKHSLLVQYRMHRDIMAVINRFYEGKLKAGLSKEQEKILKAHDLRILGVDNTGFIRPECHAYWIDSSVFPNGTPAYETFRDGSTSAVNIYEIHIIIDFLQKIAQKYSEMGYGKNKKKTVGIISFYLRQVREIRDAYRKIRHRPEFEAIDVAINTVDRFQGQEKNIIICSLVRNNERAKASRHVVAFERINVAFSRAQQMLVIVGARHMYQDSKVTMPNMDRPGEQTIPVYKNIMDELRHKAAFMDANKIITPDEEKQILQEYKTRR